jgi:UDP-N-acetylglucosamine:LPS N-acetylglucosamine transferase
LEPTLAAGVLSPDHACQNMCHVSVAYNAKGTLEKQQKIIFAIHTIGHQHSIILTSKIYFNYIRSQGSSLFGAFNHLVQRVLNLLFFLEACFTSLIGNTC